MMKCENYNINQPPPPFKSKFCPCLPSRMFVLFARPSIWALLEELGGDQNIGVYRVLKKYIYMGRNSSIHKEKADHLRIW